MAAVNLKVALEALTLKQTEFARLIGVSPRTVSLWATGETAVPGPVQAYLRVLQALPPVERAREMKRAGLLRTKMFEDGIYGLDYAAPDAPREHGQTALAVLRNGKILGSDRWGGVFTGSYDYDAVADTNSLHVRLIVPPGGELVTGHTAGAAGEHINIAGAFDRADPVTEAVVDIAGQPVEIKLKFLAPLPN